MPLKEADFTLTSFVEPSFVFLNIKLSTIVSQKKKKSVMSYREFHAEIRKLTF